jgi:hypothetical protein
MARPKRFSIELVVHNPDGQPSALCKDLLIDEKKRLGRLAKLTEDFLDEAQPMQWPAGSEGAWIYVPLADDIAICQWDPGAKALWDLGLTVGKLKVVRIIRKRDLRRFLTQAEGADE